MESLADILRRISQRQLAPADPSMPAVLAEAEAEEAAKCPSCHGHGLLAEIGADGFQTNRLLSCPDCEEERMMHRTIANQRAPRGAEGILLNSTRRGAPLLSYDKRLVIPA